MYKGKKILAIVPARGGSKGIKLKNIIKVNGKTLIQITAETLKGLNMIDKVILSSDHPLIINEAKKHGLEAPFIRPKKFSGDNVGDTPVILHAIEFFEKKKIFFDVILLIQVTSPIRKKIYIEKCIKKLVDNKLDSVFTISEVNEKYHPLKQFNISKKFINYYNSDGKKIIRRQELNKTYIRNGICYSFTNKCIKNQKDKIGKKSSYVIIKDDFVNIDDKSDLKKLKNLKL